MRLARVAQTWQALRQTRSRLAKAELLGACLAELSGPEIALGTAYLCGVLPQGRIGVGYAALRQAASVEPAAVASLTLTEVDAALDAIAAARGAGAAGERSARLAALLRRATRPEQEFLVGLLLGELRQGALEGVMVDALARSARVEPAAVRRALMLSGDLSAVAAALLQVGRAGLDRFRLELFRPVLPMLAQPAADLDAALGRLGQAALEYKLDGARVQLHKRGEEVRVYSRQLRDVSAAVPELVEAARAWPARELIADGETLAWRRDGRPHPFQTTMRRFGRRLDVEGLRAELPLSGWWFDCLQLDGEVLLDRSARERVAALAAAVPDAQRIPRIVTADPETADAFLRGALDAGHEGLMAKSLDAAYEAGGRGQAWLKLKLAHTLDLVVLAAEWGSGRRQGWLSNLHLGARDGAGFAMLGKTFKGLTDERLRWQTEQLLARETGRDAWTVYVRPELVVEVAFNDVQDSPHYPAGLALRFARVKRYRPDKRAEEADTLETVRAIHAASR
jgi:DNA ligase-1